MNALKALWGRLGRSRILGQELRRIDPDIALVSEPDAWWAAVRLKRQRGTAVVADLREIYEDRALAFPRFLRPLFRRSVRFLEKGLSKRSDEIIHVSAERQRAYDYLAKPGRVVFPYPSLPDTGEASLRSSPGSDLLAIHAGPLRANYASNELIAAMRIVNDRCPSLKLVCYGGINGKLRSIAQLQQLQEKAVIEMHPPSPPSVVLEGMKRCVFGLSLVLPVDKGHLLAQPRKFYEYLAAGLPIVAADVPTLRRLIEDLGCGVLVDARDPAAIAEAMCLLAQDPDMRARMSAAALLAARTRFNWEAEKPKLQSIFSSHGFSMYAGAQG